METSADGPDPAASPALGPTVVTAAGTRSGPVTVSLVGSTGSIGTQAVDVIEGFPDRFRVVALGAHRSMEALVAQAHRLRPEIVAIGDPAQALELSRALPRGVEVVVGAEGLATIATVAEVVVNGVVGFAGLTVTMAALEAGRRLALANKESIIAGAPVVQRARRTPGAEIIPVDSEHCAVHQCLRAGRRDDVARLLLTASGGPFRGRTREELASVDVAEALVHPTWSMGPKITVDSSTLMNKGLEVIEAHELFGDPLRRHRRGRPPPVRRPLHGGVHRRGGGGPAVPARHAPAHRVRTGVPRSPRRRLRGHRLVGAVGPRIRAARPLPLPVPRPRLPCRPGRRPGPGVAQRRQRSGRGRLPRRPDLVERHRRRGGGHPRPLRRAGGPGVRRLVATAPDRRRAGRRRRCPEGGRSGRQRSGRRRRERARHPADRRHPRRSGRGRTLVRPGQVAEKAGR